MRLLSLVALAGAVCLAVPVAGYGVPPPPRITLPGEAAGEQRSYWLAPYVFVTEMNVGRSRTATVRWMAEDGKVVREITGPQGGIEPGFVLERRPGGDVVHPVNGSWAIDLKEKPGPSGYVTSNEDGSTFVQEFHPKTGEIAADVYRDGKHLATVGPYLDYLGWDAHVGASGSLGLLIWKDQQQSIPKIVGVGADGRERFHADCDGPVYAPDPNPDGTGVLVQSNGGKHADAFAYYDKSGKVSQLDLGHNARLVGWVPGTEQALIETSIGYVFRLHLIDWRQGRQIWEAPDPSPARVSWGAAAPIAVDEKYVLVGGLEYVRWDNQQEPVRRIDALDTKTGRTIATWHPVPLYQGASDVGRFLRLGKRLYLLTDSAFAEVDLNAIESRAKGWKSQDTPESR
ncbi:MAG TPA: hypothetical protein VGI81_26690 [Tepidisphaeraceae bacterium]|jgi:hypothetical protein